MDKPSVISLFSGLGGLDLGLEASGFETRVCIEIDKDARSTLSRNRPNWKLTEQGDIHKVNPEEVLELARLKRRELFLLAGGPPCQPFSKSAYWVNGDSQRLNDPRADTLHAYMAMVEATLPSVILLENVKGLAYEGKDEGVTLLRKKFAQINKRNKTKYVPVLYHVNAADYGVPQFRERVFVVAHRDGHKLSLPTPTHCARPEANQNRLITTWDAIGDLSVFPSSQELELTGKWADLLPSIPEGQNYLWHTEKGGGHSLFGWRTRYWSFLLKLAKNRPSWTLQAAPGPATGPFHWDSRKLSIREQCRLQTIPDNYEIEGRYNSAQRQIGNAVPSAIGEMIGLEIRRQFIGSKVRRSLRLLPTPRTDCAEPTPPTPLPRKFAKQIAKHRPHPGEGFGPGAICRVDA